MREGGKRTERERERSRERKIERERKRDDHSLCDSVVYDMHNFQTKK